MEFLKDYLTEETYAKVSEELAGKDDVKLANLKSGEYVSKDKYAALEGTVSELREQLSSKSTAYDELLTKAGDNEALKTEIENLKTSSQEQLDKTTATYEAKLKTAAIKNEVIQAKAKDVNDILGQLDFNKITMENDELTGLSEQLETLKTNKPYLFTDEQKPGKGGLSHGDPDDTADENAIRATLGLPLK